jgi:hypothetical protein
MKWRTYKVSRPPRDPALDHRSDIFARLIRRYGGGMAGVVGDAASNAGLSFLGGAPRNPNLRPGAGREYSTVRYAEQEYAYTVVTIDSRYCAGCGRYTLERHTLGLRAPGQQDEKVGHVEVCATCNREHWMFRSQMPSNRARREMLARYVP